jgi:hypothetical protein
MAAPRELTKLPRALKRTLLLGMAVGSIKDKHHYGETRNVFLVAQNSFVESKNKRVDVSDK